MLDGLGFPTALQFKPDGRGGYLYRKDQIGPALPATAAERDAHVRWMGWMVGLGTVLVIPAIVVMAVIAEQVLGDSRGAGTVGVAGALVMAAVVFGGLYLFMRWASHSAARAFAGRTAVEPAQTRKQVFGRRMARVTYTRIAGVCAGLAVTLVLGTLDEPGAIWLVIALPAAVGLGFALWKWRIESE